MQRYCANCGTEVDETAAFCPTCGQPIDQVAETEIPPAPAWPEAPRERAAAPEPDEPAPSRQTAERFEEPTRVKQAPEAAAHDRWVEERTAPPPPPRAAAAPPPTGEGAPRGQPAGVDLPITWPVTLSAWLIGVGALVGAVGLVVGMFRVINAIDLLILLALIGIAITVFFSASVPAFRHLRLATLVAVLIGFGIAIDRIGFGLAGVGELLLFIGTAAAAIGAILLEIGQDQPLGGARG